MRIVVIQQEESEYASYVNGMLLEYASWLAYPIWPLAHRNQAAHALYFQEVPVAGKFKSLLQQQKLKKDIAAVNPQVVVYLDSLLQVNQTVPALAFISTDKLIHIPSPYPIPVFTSHRTDELPETSQVFPVSIPGTYKVLEWQDKLLARSGFTGNNEYFISLIKAEPIEAVVDLLKAFSHFKKWQQSSMQLILVCNTGEDIKPLKNKLSTYKYRDDVVLSEDISDAPLAGLLASAYAYIHHPAASENTLPVLAALQCGTPVISTTTGLAEAYLKPYDKGLLIAESGSIESTGLLLQRIYKDENLRNKLSSDAPAYAAVNNYELLKKQLWRNLLSVAGIET